jgi:hypothetical protein
MPTLDFYGVLEVYFQAVHRKYLDALCGDSFLRRLSEERDANPKWICSFPIYPSLIHQRLFFRDPNSPSLSIIFVEPGNFQHGTS